MPHYLASIANCCHLVGPDCYRCISRWQKEHREVMPRKDSFFLTYEGWKQTVAHLRFLLCSCSYGFNNTTHMFCRYNVSNELWNNVFYSFEEPSSFAFSSFHMKEKPKQQRLRVYSTPKNGGVARQKNVRPRRILCTFLLMVLGHTRGPNCAIDT